MNVCPSTRYAIDSYRDIETGKRSGQEWVERGERSVVNATAFTAYTSITIYDHPANNTSYARRVSNEAAERALLSSYEFGPFSI